MKKILMYKKSNVIISDNVLNWIILFTLALNKNRYHQMDPLRTKQKNY